MPTKIPIQNIYYLLCYAWDCLPQSGFLDIDRKDIEKPIDLLASVLVDGTKHLVRRGLDQGYRAQVEEMTTIRGRVRVAESARRLLLIQGKAICEFDELSVSTIPNQILKAALSLVSVCLDVDAQLRHEAGKLVRRLHQIESVPLDRRLFRKVQLHGNNRFYRFILNVCRLILDQSLLNEENGTYRFKDFVQDDRKMAKLFERFLHNFYKREQSEYNVKKERIYWQAESTDDPSLSMLPTMETDISLRSKSKTLIIDAKYYSNTLQTYYDSESVHSANLYQMFSYLKNLEPRGGNDARAEGVLLYPRVSNKLSKSYQLHGHTIRIETIDLFQDWKGIHNSLLDLVREM